MIQTIRDHFLTRQFLLYALIGVSGVVIDVLLFFLLHTVWGVPALLATVISVSAGIINNFFLNRNFNFKRTDDTLRRFLSFYAVGATGILLSFLCIVLFQGVIDTTAEVAKLISVPFIVAFQFWFNKHASFAEKAGTIPVRQLVVFAVCIGCFVIAGLSGPHTNFSDEHDNLLGGRLLLEGGVIYKDFFSHHMPLQYFVAVPFYALFGNDLVASKVVFGLVLTLWLLCMSRHLYKRYGVAAWSLFVLLLSTSHILIWTNMFLAETFAAYSAVHLFILFWTRRDRTFGLGTVGTYAALAAVPLLSSASFIGLSLVGYALLIIEGWHWAFGRRLVLKAVARVGLAMLLCAVPYMLLLGYLLATGALHDFKRQAFSFNVLYYSQFVPEVGKDGLESLYLQVMAIINGLQTVLFRPENGSFLLRSLAIFTLLSALLLATLKKRWLGLAMISAAFMVVAAVRGGIVSTFMPGRAGTILAALILTILFVYAMEIRRERAPTGFEKGVGLAIAALFVYVFVAALHIAVPAVYDYRNMGGMVSIPHTKGTVVSVINAVNEPDDAYWVGPLDFYSQTHLISRNASNYTFYLPWHAACPECKADLLADLMAEQPRVVYWDDSGSIHGRPTAEYGVDIAMFLDQNGYYQVRDAQLKFFYFHSQYRTDTDKRLQAQGFAL